MRNDELILTGAPVIEGDLGLSWMAFFMSDYFCGLVRLFSDVVFFVVLLIIFLFFI